MIRSIIAALALTVSTFASATTINQVVFDTSLKILSDVVTQGPFHFVVGDQTNYKMNIGGFINGTMSITVKTVADDEVVLAQDIDMSFLGKQACEQTFNPNTGAVKKIVCNGQEQKPSDGSFEMIENKEDTVTVPAGTFTCLYVKAKNTKDNSEIEQWINPKAIPVMGMAKMIAPSQIGKMTVELTSFKRN
jgi:hypothetical protein